MCVLTATPTLFVSRARNRAGIIFDSLSPPFVRSLWENESVANSPINVLFCLFSEDSRFYIGESLSFCH